MSRLLPRYCMIGTDETRLIDKEIPDREVDRVAAPLDTDSEHAVNHELDHLWPIHPWIE